MATLADDTGTFDVAVTVPEDGDLRDAASVSHGMTSLTRRTRWAHDALLRENGNPGVYRMRQVSATGFLRLIAVHVQGDLCWVVTAAAGARLYIYSETSTEADDDEFIVKPANVSGPNPGRWLDVNRYTVDNLKKLLAPHGIVVTGNAEIDGSGSVTGNWVVIGELGVAGNAGVNNLTANNLTAAGGVNAAYLGASGDIGCGGDAIVIGTVLALDGLQVGTSVTPKDAQVYGRVKASGGIDIAAPSTLTQPLVASGAGRIRGRVSTMTTDADQTIGASNTSVFIVPVALMTAARSITLQAIGAGPGDIIEVVTDETAWGVNVKDSTGTSLQVLLRQSGLQFSARFIFVGTDWRLLSYCKG